MPPDDQPPRRRISDKDRRKWPDQALDQLSERVDDSAERLAALDRRISELRSDQLETRREVNRRLDTIETTLSENFKRNFREHREVKNTADKIAEHVAPTRMDKAKDFALILSLLLMPILTTYGLSH